MTTNAPDALADDLLACGMAAEVSVWHTSTPGGPGYLAHRLSLDPRCLTIVIERGRPTRPLLRHVDDDCRCGDYTSRLTVQS